MFSRSRISLGLALLLTLLFAIPVFAGGWAVITLDELPNNVVAGAPISVGFMVRQHGRTLMSDLTPTITAHLSNSTEAIVVEAKPEGETGHYVAALTFPKAGNWEWRIQAFTMDQPMPVLSVSAPVESASQPVTKTDSKPALFSPLMIVRALALTIGFIGLAVAFRRRSRPAVALTALCLLIGLASFVAGTTVAEVEAQSKSPVQSQNPASLSQVELGRRLFVAKGCVTCHTNSKVSDMMGSITIDEGPNLTIYSNDPDYLEKWLFKPSAIKPATKMPDLNLSENEIKALIAFINSK